MKKLSHIYTTENIEWVNDKKKRMPAKNAYVPKCKQNNKKQKEKNKSMDEFDPTIYTVLCAA